MLEEKNREIEKYVYDMKEKNTPENIQSFTFKKEKEEKKHPKNTGFVTFNVSKN